MNTHPQNKYEVYEVDSEIPILHESPTQATKYFTVETCIQAVRMLYGEPDTSSNNPNELLLAPHFGWDNSEVINAWFQIPKLTLVHRLELQISPRNVPPGQPDQAVNQDTNNDDEEGQLPEKNTSDAPIQVIETNSPKKNSDGAHVQYYTTDDESEKTGPAVLYGRQN